MHDNPNGITFVSINNNLSAINKNLDALIATLDRMADNQEKELHEIATDCYENFGTVAYSLEALLMPLKV